MEKSRFVWVGNWPAIDFVNTAIVAEGRPVDLLAGEGALWAWLREAGMAAPELGEEGRARALGRAVEYRSLLRRSLEAWVQGLALPEKAPAQTNALLAEGASAPRLVEDGGRFTLGSGPAAPTPGGLLAPLALSFARLLTEADPGRVRKCRNPACVLWFLDTSKSGTRAWCSLAMCGNKMRMAASRRNRAG